MVGADFAHGARRRSKNSGGGIAPAAIGRSYRGPARQRQRFPDLPVVAGYVPGCLIRS